MLLERVGLAGDRRGSGRSRHRRCSAARSSAGARAARPPAARRCRERARRRRSAARPVPRRPRPRGAEGGGDRAVDPVRPAVGEHARPIVARRRRTPRRRGSASTTRRTASPRAGATPPSERATSGSDSARRRASARSRRATALVGRAPRREPVPVACDSSASRARSSRACGGSASRRRASGSCHAPSGSNAIWAVLEPGQPRAQRLGGRQLAGPEHELRRELLGELRVAQQQVVVGDRGRAASRARQRVGEQRDPGPRGKARQLRRRVRGRGPAGDDHDPRRTGGVPAGRRGGPGAVEDHVGRPAGAAGVVLGERGSASSTSGSRSGKLRWTGPGGPPARSSRPGTRASGSTAGRRAWPRGRRPRRTT